MRWQERGSYTVEGAVIIPLICVLCGIIIGLGFYCHDRMVLQGVADELAVSGSKWIGSYVNPVIKEVDYVLLKQSGEVSCDILLSKGYEMLSQRLLWAEDVDISVSQGLFGKEIQVEINSCFSIGRRSVPCRVSGQAAIFRSRDLPRKSVQEDGA